MLRLCVLCCAMAGLLGMVVGCSSVSDTKPIVTQAQKDQAVKDIKANLDALDKKLADLKARIEKSSGEEKVELEKKWKESAGKREALEKKFEKLKTEVAEKWSAAKKELEDEYEELKKKLQ